MPEAGGPTTQSGIYYQNSWTARFLARLIDSRPQNAREMVVEVRAEAPEHVDDTVVTFKDRHRLFIQAKESFATSGDTWKKLWEAFRSQARTLNDRDELWLAVGTPSGESRALLEVCDRARGKDTATEWWEALSQDQKRIADTILAALGETKEGLWPVIKRVDVVHLSLKEIEEEKVPAEAPASTVAKATLFSLLRDQVGGAARVRATFRQADLLERLHREHGVTVFDVADWGMDTYRETIARLYGQLSVPGTNVAGAMEDLFLWLPLRDRKDDTGLRDFEEENPFRYRERAERTISLESFPLGDVRRAIIDASAGFGKTTLLRALTHRLSGHPVRVPVIVPLDALAASPQIVVLDFLEQINKQYAVDIDWARLCEGGRAVLFFDGLDELSDDGRVRVTEAIGYFSARFPDVAWLLTVRDGRAVPQALQAERLDIERLDVEQIIALAKAYARAGATSLPPEQLREHMRKHPDLGRLLQIPLFLALAVATTQPGDDLPRTRTDLLERYLSLLFEPHRHFKPTQQPVTVPDDLREVAEHLAFEGLERGRLGLSEQEALKLLKTGYEGRAREYVDRLIQLGVLAHQPPRLRFTYPVIQEYLAARHLLAADAATVAERFERAVQRPWAQALQFCLEQHSQADAIIRARLDEPDDAFHTTLRLIGRCIANGARVSGAVRRMVGERLVAAWGHESWTVSDAIGQLVAGAFSDALPDAAESLILPLLHVGGREILVARRDPALTERVLRAYLDRDLTHWSSLYGWQNLVDEIGSLAFDLYRDRAKRPNLTPQEASSLCQLLKALPPPVVAKEKWLSLGEDPALPSIIQLLGLVRGGKHQVAHGLIGGLWHAPEYASDAATLLWDLKGAAEAFVNACAVPETSEKFIASACDVMLRVRTGEDNSRLIRRAAEAAAGILRRQKLLVVAAALGDEAAAMDIATTLATADDEVVELWVRHLNHFSLAASKTGLHHLHQRRPLAEEPLALLRALGIGIRYKVAVGMSESYEITKQEKKHILFDEFNTFALTNIESPGNDILRSLSVRQDLGEDISEYQKYIVDALEHYLSVSPPTDDDDYESLGAFSAGLSILSSDGSPQVCQLLRDLINTDVFPVTVLAAFQLAEGGSEADLEWLVNAANRLRTRRVLLAEIESFALRLGRRVVRDEGGRLRLEEAT